MIYDQVGEIIIDSTVGWSSKRPDRSSQCFHSQKIDSIGQTPDLAWPENAFGQDMRLENKEPAKT